MSNNPSEQEGVPFRRPRGAGQEGREGERRMSEHTLPESYPVACCSEKVASLNQDAVSRFRTGKGQPVLLVLDTDLPVFQRDHSQVLSP